MPNVQDEPRPWLARLVLLGARGVTAMVVGSGALLGIFSSDSTTCPHEDLLISRIDATPGHTFEIVSNARPISRRAKSGQNLFDVSILVRDSNELRRNPNPVAFLTHHGFKSRRRQNVRKQEPALSAAWAIVNHFGVVVHLPNVKDEPRPLQY